MGYFAGSIAALEQIGGGISQWRRFYMSASSSALRSSQESVVESTPWTKLERTFVAERVRMIAQLPVSTIRGHVRELVETAPRHLLAQEIATTIYLTVNTPETNGLNALMHLWEAVELPVRKEVREAFEKQFGSSIRSVLGHRLPEHLKSVFSW